jgi:MFS family permease
MARRAVLELMQSRLYRSWLLTLLLLMSMFGFIDRQIIGALAEPIKIDLGISDSQLGLLGGLAFALLYSVLSIPLARLAEHHNRVIIYGIGILLWSAATISCGFASSFVLLLLARIAVGVGETTQPAAISLTADYYPPDRRVATSSITVLAVPLGAFVGSFAGGAIAELADWHWAFFAAGAPGLVLGALFLLTIREPLRGRYDPPSEHGDAVPPLSAALRRMVQRRAFLHVAIGSSLASAGGFGINLFVAPYFVRRFGMGFADSGLIAGLISAVPGVVSMFAGGQLANRLARRDVRFYAWTPGIGVLLACPLYILSLLQGRWLAAAAAFMVTGIFQYIYLPCSAGVYANTMEPRMRATASAIVGMLTSVVGAGAGPLIVGTLSDAMASKHLGRDYALACPRLGTLDSQLLSVCREASAVGLQWGMMLTALIYLWGAVHFFLAARTMARDLA